MKGGADGAAGGVGRRQIQLGCWHMPLPPLGLSRFASPEIVFLASLPRMLAARQARSQTRMGERAESYHCPLGGC
jgi:hypothetical protein